MMEHQTTEIIDDGKVFVIDKDTKEISGEILKLSQFMNNSERVTIKMPRYIEGHDMLLCNYITIHYDNISADRESVNSDVYEVEDLKLKEGTDDVLTFTWLISRNATQLIGTVEFSVHFDCLTDGVSVYTWGTTVSRLIRILESKNNSPSVIAENSDILQQHTDKIDKLNDNVEALSKKHDGDFKTTNERIDTANSEIAKTNKAVENLNKSLTQSIKSVGESATQGITEVNKKIDELPQPDWNENNETSAAFVKNRTHRKYISEVDLVPEMPDINFMTNGIAEIVDGDLGFAELTAGNTYNVHWNGTKYGNLVGKPCTMKDTSYSGIAIGNLSLWDMGIDTGEPFLYCYFPSLYQGAKAVYIVDSAGNDDNPVTFRLTENAEMYEPFDGKFLPKGLGYIIKEGEQTATNKLTWDGSTEGRENIPLNATSGCYKVTDTAPSISDFVGSTVVFGYDREERSLEITEDMIVVTDGPVFAVMSDDLLMVYVVTDDFSQEGVSATKGVYLPRFVEKIDDGTSAAYYVKSITALTDCFVTGEPTEVKKIDNRLLDLEWIPTKTVKETPIWDNVSLELSGNFTDGATAMLHSSNDKYFELVSGKKYNVTWNGNAYKNLEALEFEGDAVVVIGNLSSEGGSGAGIPFVIAHQIDSALTLIRAVEIFEDATVTVSVAEVEYEYNKLPEGYLPDFMTDITVDKLPDAITVSNFPELNSYGPYLKAKGALAKGLVAKTENGETVLFAYSNGDAFASNSAVCVSQNGINFYNFGNDYRTGLMIPASLLTTENNGKIVKISNGAVCELADQWVINSSTEGSNKKFRITVDDSGTISATEVTE